MRSDLARCLPDTGAGATLLWLFVAGAVLAIGGVLISSRGRTRSDAGHVGLRLLGGVALLLPLAAWALAAAGSASAAPGCGTAHRPVVELSVEPTRAIVDPPNPPTPTSTPTATPPPPPSCPAGGDVTDLPAGQTLSWTAVPATDPRHPGATDGEVVWVPTGAIGSYTWAVVGDGGASAPCPGMPVGGDACVPYPQALQSAQWFWSEFDQQWLPGSRFRNTDGCATTETGGGNNGHSNGHGNNGNNGNNNHNSNRVLLGRVQ